MTEDEVPNYVKLKYSNPPLTPQQPQLDQNWNADEYFKNNPNVRYSSSKSFWLTSGAGTYDARFSGLGGIAFSSILFWPISFIYYSRIFIPPIISAPLALGGLFWASTDSDGFQYGYLAVGFLSLFIAIIAFFVSLAASLPTDKASIAKWATARGKQIDSYFYPGSSNNKN